MNQLINPLNPNRVSIDTFSFNCISTCCGKKVHWSFGTDPAYKEHNIAVINEFLQRPGGEDAVNIVKISDGTSSLKVRCSTDSLNKLQQSVK